jgi:uncharacterized protein YdeI (YjbR/CyaY-like superfamily)
LVKRIDDQRYIQKFTPRKTGSKWSQSNVKRMERLIKEGKMTEAGLQKYKKVNSSEPVSKIKDSLKTPSDFEICLRKNKKVYETFISFAPSYKKNYILWISSAKKKETRKKRIQEAIQLIEKGVKNLLK